MMEKLVNAKIKTSFQQFFKIYKIDSKYVKDYRLANKNKTTRYNQDNQDNWDENTNKFI